MLLLRTIRLIIQCIVHYRQLVFWMSIGAVETVRTESSQVVLTDQLSHMLVAAIWAMLTKSSSVPRTFLLLAFWINVEIHTLVSITALAVFGVKPALWHLLHVEHM